MDNSDSQRNADQRDQGAPGESQEGDALTAGHPAMPPSGRLWARLSDRARPPRCWWYPLPSTHVRDRDTIKYAHEKYTETVSRTMFTLIGLGFVLLLTIASAPDRWLLLHENKLKVPYAEVSISFPGFTLIAPILLIVILIYLHIFYGYWLDLERERRDLNARVLAAGVPVLDSTPSLFVLPGLVPRIFTNLIFYWWAPVVFLTAAWKASGLLFFGRLHALACLLFTLTGMTAFVLLFLQIRRCRAEQRGLWNAPRWALLAVIVTFTVAAASDPVARRQLHRPMQLSGEDLKGAWLGYEDLPRASLYRANLEGVDLSNADLRLANLWRANLQDAILEAADLRGATLHNVNLRRATLRRADLRLAKLHDAILEEADLWGADLREADGLEVSQVKRARNWEKALYSPNQLQRLDLPRGHNFALQARHPELLTPVGDPERERLMRGPTPK